MYLKYSPYLTDQRLSPAGQGLSLASVHLHDETSSSGGIRIQHIMRIGHDLRQLEIRLYQPRHIFLPVPLGSLGVLNQIREIGRCRRWPRLSRVGEALETRIGPAGPERQSKSKRHVSIKEITIRPRQTGTFQLERPFLRRNKAGCDLVDTETVGVPDSAAYQHPGLAVLGAVYVRRLGIFAWISGQVLGEEEKGFDQADCGLFAEAGDVG